MKKYILLLLLGILAVSEGNAQADCFFKYCYVGNLSFKVTKGHSVSVQLPSPELMLNIVSQAKGYINAELDNRLNYEKESLTTGSSIFCGTPDYIINKILKGSQKTYTIYITDGKNRYQRKIKVQDIVFTFEEGTFYIRLPQVII